MGALMISCNHDRLKIKEKYENNNKTSYQRVRSLGGLHAHTRDKIVQFSCRGNSRFPAGSGEYLHQADTGNPDFAGNYIDHGAVHFCD
jgi:hypothetical protein